MGAECGCGTVEVDSEAREIDPRELVDNDIFTTPLAACSYPYSDLGLISATYAQAKFSGSGGVTTIIKNMGYGADKVRAMALARLRSKCKTMGGNAILAVKFDVETEGYCQICVATGAAVVMQQPQQQQQIVQIVPGGTELTVNGGR